MYYKGQSEGRLEVYYLNETHAPIQILSFSDGETDIEPAREQLVFPPSRSTKRALYAAVYDTASTTPLSEELFVRFSLPGSDVVRR